MPILKHAIKKQKQDKKRTMLNARVKTKAKGIVKQIKADPKANSGLLSQAFSMLDRAAKKGVFHKRKADRLKSRLSKLVAK